MNELTSTKLNETEKQTERKNFTLNSALKQNCDTCLREDKRGYGKKCLLENRFKIGFTRPDASSYATHNVQCALDDNDKTRKTENLISIVHGEHRSA